LIGGVALGEAGVVVLFFGVDALGRILIHGRDIVGAEVERSDDIEGHLAVKTETLKADGIDLVAILVEGTNLKRCEIVLFITILEREGGRGRD
jgi:hypothetical protein